MVKRGWMSVVALLVGATLWAQQAHIYRPDPVYNPGPYAFDLNGDGQTETITFIQDKDNPEVRIDNATYPMWTEAVYPLLLDGEWVEGCFPWDLDGDGVSELVVNGFHPGGHRTTLHVLAYRDGRLEPIPFYFDAETMFDHLVPWDGMPRIDRRQNSTTLLTMENRFVRDGNIEVLHQRRATFRFDKDQGSFILEEKWEQAGTRTLEPEQTGVSTEETKTLSPSGTKTVCKVPHKDRCRFYSEEGKIKGGLPDFPGLSKAEEDVLIEWLAHTMFRDTPKGETNFDYRHVAAIEEILLCGTCTDLTDGMLTLELGWAYQEMVLGVLGDEGRFLAFMREYKEANDGAMMYQGVLHCDGDFQVSRENQKAYDAIFGDIDCSDWK